MTLEQLIRVVKSVPAETVLPRGFSERNSYRGSYDELSLTLGGSPTTAGEVVAFLEAIPGQLLQGWKGGDFEMYGWTEVHLTDGWSDSEYEATYTFMEWWAERFVQGLPDA